MKVKELDSVVLDRDFPEQGLRKGDLGAVVQVYSPDHLEVEFIRASGRTQVLVSLSTADVRKVRDEDLIAFRQELLEGTKALSRIRIDPIR